MKAVKFLVGVFLLPVCFAVTQTLAGLIRSADAASHAAFALAGGFLFWLFLYFTLPRPARSYVLAHELTHALWGALMGARVLNIRVAKESGSVTLSKSNFLITLAPYFFPLYTMLIIAAYSVLSIFFAVDEYRLYWLALVGFTWGFHVTFTISTMLEHQSDIRENGNLFSCTVIYLFNVIGLCCWVVAISGATLERMMELLGASLTNIASACWQTGARLLSNFLQ